MWRKLRPHLTALLSYALLAVLATWPLVLNITTHFPSADEWYGGDPHTFIWFLDWLAKSLNGSTAVEPGRMVFFPNGIDPWAGYDGILMTVIGVPAILVGSNPVLAYNLIILASFTAAALTAYALVLALSKSFYAAWFAGFAYGFSTFLLVRGLQHANLCLILAVPLLFLAAWRFGGDPDRRKAWWLAGAVLLNGLTSFYYHVGGLIFLLLAGLYFRRRLLRRWRVSVFAGVLSAAAAALPALPVLLNHRPSLRTYPSSFVDNLGADPTNFFLPHPLTNIFGRLTQDAYNRLPRVFWGGYNLFEITSYIGLPLILLAGLWLWRRRSVGARTEGLWAGTAVLFLVLSMGTQLRLGPWHVPMPFAVLRRIFPFSLVRSPNRLFVFALLAVIILAAFSLLYLRSVIKSRFWFVAFNIVLFAGLAAERIIFPYPLFTTRVSEFYDTVSRDPNGYAIADLPITYPGISEYNYYQTIHGKPLVDGEYFYPAYKPDTASFIRSNPLLLASVCQQDRPVTDRPPDRQAALRDLAAHGVRYVVVHNLILLNGANCGEPRRFIRDFFADVEPNFTDGEITVYKLPDPAPLR